MTTISRAHAALPPAAIFAALRQTAADLGLALTEAGDALTVRLALGELTVRPEGAGTALRLTAASPSKLQALRDTVAERIASAAPGTALQWSDGARAGDRPANVSVLEVAAVTRISPSYVRVRLAGEVARFAEPGNGYHFKLLFGPDGCLAPDLDDAGLTRWPGGIGAWHRPTYTTRAIDAAAGWLDADVFLHDGGRTTDWCRSVAPGARIAISGPGGGTGLEAPWIGLVGDETALPVIARMLEAAAPDTRGEAVILIPDAADAQQIAVPAGVRLRHVTRGTGETPLSLLTALEVPDAGRFVFLAAERAEAQAAREWLTAQGLARAEFRTAAYWTAAPG